MEYDTVQCITTSRKVGGNVGSPEGRMVLGAECYNQGWKEVYGNTLIQQKLENTSELQFEGSLDAVVWMVYGSLTGLERGVYQRR